MFHYRLEPESFEPCEPSAAAQFGFAAGDPRGAHDGELILEGVPGALCENLARPVQSRATVLRRKAAIVIEAVATNRLLLSRILLSPRLRPVRAELRRQPRIATFLAVPFLCAGWTATQRLERIVDHALTIAKLGGPFIVARGARNVLCDLPDPLGGYSIAIEAPRSMVRDGLLTLALIHEQAPIFTLSFTLAHLEGRRVAYVGGVQGSAGGDALEQYRAFTKAAFRIRPRDFMIEMFRLVCDRIGVEDIHGVADAFRHQKDAYFDIGAVDYDKVKLDYDTMWTERGGVRQGDAFFVLAVCPPERSLEEVPARKRALHARRTAMWTEIGASLAWIAR